MKTATLLVVSLGMVCACNIEPDRDLETAEVLNVGLQADVAVPPKGIGVAPILGYPGPVPASVPAASVGANGPGSLSLYGGQWLVPLPVKPGSKIANASCDFISNSSTVATVELVGQSGVITSKTFGPASNVLLTLWLVPTDANPNGYTVADGEAVVIRASFRDSVTGGWTSGAQQVPMLGCAVNANGATKRMFLAPVAFKATAGAANVTLVTGFEPGSGLWQHNPLSGAYELEAPLVVPTGATISKIEAFFKRSSARGPDDQYIMHLLARTLTVGAPPANQIDMSTTVRGSDPNHFPNLDSMTLSNLPTAVTDDTVYVVTWKGFAVDGGVSDDAFFGIGITLN